MKFHPGLPNFEILKVAFEFVIPSILVLFFTQEISLSPSGIRSYCATLGPCLQPRGTHDMSKIWVVAFATHMVFVLAQISLHKGQFFRKFSLSKCQFCYN